MLSKGLLQFATNPQEVTSSRNHAWVGIIGACLKCSVVFAICNWVNYTGGDSI